MYDVIVVGASPAGIMATWKASLSGARVLLLDRKTRLGVDHQPADTTFTGMFKRTGLNIRDEYLVHRVRGMHIVSPAGFRFAINSPGFVVDRQAFDLYYLGLAHDSGAEIKAGALVVGLENSLGKRRVIVRELGEKKIYDGKIIVGADGIESYIAKWAGIRPMVHPNEIASSVQAEMIGVENEYPDYFQYFLGSQVAPGWKATVSPKGDSKASVGAFVRNAPRPAIYYFDNFVYKNGKEKFRDAKILKMQAGGDPVATIPNQTVGDGVMVVGGAAGQAGLSYGMLCGIFCGEVAAESIEADDQSKPFLSKYQQRWRKELLTEYRLGYYMLKAIEKMRDEDLDSIVKSLQDTDVSERIPRHQSLFGKGMSGALLVMQKDPRILNLVTRILPV